MCIEIVRFGHAISLKITAFGGKKKSKTRFLRDFGLETSVLKLDDQKHARGKPLPQHTLRVSD